MGPKTLIFEKEFSRYIGTANSIAVNSCTAALHLALKAIDLRPGDEVLVPAMTFVATSEVVCYFGAKPIIVDVDKETLLLDAAKIEEYKGKYWHVGKAKAIIPVHYGGLSCNMDAIWQVAETYRLRVVEDAAHALPAWYKGKKIGSFGDLTCFSFYATKTLATGEGGMVTTKNEEWANKIRILRLHGISTDAWDRYSEEGSWYYEVVEAGYKYNMTDIQSALGCAQLRKLDWMWEKRKRIANKYTEGFKSLNEISIPPNLLDRESAWHLYTIKLNLEMLKIDRNNFIKELSERGIGASVHFIPLYRHPFYRRSFGYIPKHFPASEWLYERIVSLPIYPGMSDNEVDTVTEAVHNIVKRFRR
jgi:perosamine synthetase